MVNEPEQGNDLAALTQLRDLLVEEREALKSRDHDRILDCAQRKAARAAQMQDLLPTRETLAAIAPAERARITELAAECERLNRANGVMVMALRGVVDRALVILRGEDPDAQATVYGPSGNRLASAAARYAGSA